jgi:outer membrane protein TolC
MQTIFWRLLFSGVLVGGGCASPCRAQSMDVTLETAVRTTLATHPGLMVQREQVNIERGRQQQASAQFETLLGGLLTQDRTNSPLQGRERSSLIGDGLQPSSNQALDVGRAEFGATKRYRTGVALDLTTAVTRTTDNLLYDTGVSRSLTRAVMTVPMAGSRGRAVVAAEEAATSSDVTSSLLDLQQTTAQLISNTARSYWNLVTAKKQLQIALDSEARGRRLHDNVRMLIDADLSPLDDLHNVAANLAERTGSRIAAEQRVIDLRRDLAVQMGIDAATFAGLPDAVDDLPDGQLAAPPDLDEATVQCYVETAVRTRADLHATNARVQAAQARLVAARDLFRPRVDVKLSVGYAGMREGLSLNNYVTAWLQGGRGLDAQFGLAYAGRSRELASGETLEAQAVVRQAELQQNDLDRGIRSSVVQALSAVRNSIARLKSAAESVESSRQALDGQEERLRLGVASVIELLTVEDRLTNGLLKLADARLAYPQAVMQLRLVTGAITSADQPTALSDPTILFRMPACEGSRSAPREAPGSRR